MSMELTPSIVLFLAFLSLLLLGRYKYKAKAKDQEVRRPPSPWNLPLIGSIHRLITSQAPHALQHLAEKHGPVMYLKLGQIDTVVISSPEAAQEVLRIKDTNFASRPSLLSSEIMCYGNLDIAFSPYGSYWRALRKVCILELLSTRKVKQFASIRRDETLSLIKEVDRAHGSPVNIAKLLLSCANKITMKATFGDYGSSSNHQEEFFKAIDVALRSSLGFCVSDIFPSLRFIDVISGLKSRLLRAHRQLDAIFNEIINECERKRKSKTTAAEHEQKGEDLLNVLLRIRDEESTEEFALNTTNIKAIILDMFIAGTETTSSTAEWVMTELMRNPRAMAKAQVEVRQVLDKSPNDHESHLDELHYTKMVIKESLRLHPPVPLLLPRVCRETCEIGGFKVTKGSRVIINAWAIATNPKYWDDAEAFRPERFEDSSIDFKGANFEYIPFGSGRRICPGMGFGLASAELMVAELLYYFDWRLPYGMSPDNLDMRVNFGATARKKEELYIVASPKVSLEI